jgi:glycosyltransferase involved in cell wall biosynthesis
MEGWGMTTIEANACGTPVVASNVGGLRDSVYNLHSGYLVPYGDVDVFAQRIMELLQDDDTRNRMSEEATAWARNFDWDKSAEDFLGLLL